MGPCRIGTWRMEHAGSDFSNMDPSPRAAAFTRLPALLWCALHVLEFWPGELGASVWATASFRTDPPVPPWAHPWATAWYAMLCRYMFYVHGI